MRMEEEKPVQGIAATTPRSKRKKTPSPVNKENGKSGDSPPLKESKKDNTDRRRTPLGEDVRNLLGKAKQFLSFSGSSPKPSSSVPAIPTHPAPLLLLPAKRADEQKPSSHNPKRNSQTVRGTTSLFRGRTGSRANVLSVDLGNKQKQPAKTARSRSVIGDRGSISATRSLNFSVVPNDFQLQISPEDKTLLKKYFKKTMDQLVILHDYKSLALTLVELGDGKLEYLPQVEFADSEDDFILKKTNWYGKCNGEKQALLIKFPAEIIKRQAGKLSKSPTTEWTIFVHSNHVTREISIKPEHALYAELTKITQKNFLEKQASTETSKQQQAYIRFLLNKYVLIPGTDPILGEVASTLDAMAFCHYAKDPVSDNSRGYQTVSEVGEGGGAYTVPDFGEIETHIKKNTVTFVKEIKENHEEILKYFAKQHLRRDITILTLKKDNSKNDTLKNILLNWRSRREPGSILFIFDRYNWQVYIINQDQTVRSEVILHIREESDIEHDTLFKNFQYVLNRIKVGMLCEKDHSDQKQHKPFLAMAKKRNYKISRDISIILDSDKSCSDYSKKWFSQKEKEEGSVLFFFDHEIKKWKIFMIQNKQLQEKTIAKINGSNLERDELYINLEFILLNLEDAMKKTESEIELSTISNDGYMILEGGHNHSPDYGAMMHALSVRYMDIAVPALSMAYGADCTPGGSWRGTRFFFPAPPTPKPAIPGTKEAPKQETSDQPTISLGGV